MVVGLGAVLVLRAPYRHLNECVLEYKITDSRGELPHLGTYYHLKQLICSPLVI